jgi:hypothetical protein
MSRDVRTLAALAVTLALTALAAGCGGSDDDAAASDDEAAVAAAFKAVESAFAAGDAERFCAGMTPAGQRQSALLTAAGPRTPDCVKSTRAVVKLNREAGLKQTPAKVVSVKVDRGTAIATVRDRGNQPLRVRFVKRDGRWKMDATQSAPISPTVRNVPE